MIQTKPGIFINTDHPIAQNLVTYFMFNEGAGGGIFDSIARGRNAVLTNFAMSGSTSNWVGSPFGSALNFDGSNDYATVPLNLSAYNKLSVSFWMNITTFNNLDGFAFEFTPTANSNNGAFYVDPNASNGYIEVGSNSTSGLSTAFYTRPSASVWHHYVVLHDISLNPNTISLYIDGVLQARQGAYTQATNLGTFANNTLYLASRGGTSLYGASSMCELRIYGGRHLTESDVITLYSNPHIDLIRPIWTKQRQAYRFFLGMN